MRSPIATQAHGCRSAAFNPWLLANDPSRSLDASFDSRSRVRHAPFRRVASHLGIARNVLTPRSNGLIAADILVQVQVPVRDDALRMGYPLTEKGRDLLPRGRGQISHGDTGSSRSVGGLQPAASRQRYQFKRAGVSNLHCCAFVSDANRFVGFGRVR